MDKLNFSVIIPSFNRNQELRDCLERISRQTYKNFEVIVIDDCSSVPVCIEQDFGLSICLIRNIKNQGAAQSRNIGVQNARGEWIVFLDDDDYFEDDKMAELSKIIANHKINFIYHPAKMHLINEQCHYITKPESNVQSLSIENMLNANQIGGTSMIAMTRELFLESGGFCGELKAVEDYEFLLRVVQNKSFRPYFLAKPLTNCVLVTQKKSVSKNLEQTKIAFDYIKSHYANTKELEKVVDNNLLSAICYVQVCNLDRDCGYSFFKLFLKTKQIKLLVASVLGFISPSLVLKLRSRL